MAKDDDGAATGVEDFRVKYEVAVIVETVLYVTVIVLPAVV